MQIAEKVERTERRELRRRQVLRRRLIALAVLGLLAVAAVFGIVRLAVGSAGTVSLTPVTAAAPASPFRTALPQEIRGIHVTMDLASLPGKIAAYLALTRDGLNTLELDVKDETGAVGFVDDAPAIAVHEGAARPFYDPRAVAREAHRAGVYLIGRVVAFEDPITSAAHPALAVHRSDGSLWRTSGGLGWLNPYSRAAWTYDVDVAVTAAKAGFDEIQFDYVRFPSDGDVSSIRYPGAHTQTQQQTVAAFLRYAASRLHPLGVRVSADVFGLSATHDLGIGQTPAEIGKVVDTIYPMTYPSHYRPGEYNLPDPNAAPRATVSDSLADFRTQLAGTRALLVPWLQDFSLGRTYRPADVAAQIAAARSFDTGGYMLWNARGVYTAGELRAGPPPPLPAVAAPTL
ncbi:MAG TPA: putative glycoside hydrolase [Gaiellaceae bacterium]|nr:putative glycoside hydrolase [Gaiellaceae bacterium]